MFDTVNMWLDCGVLPDGFTPSEILPYIDNVTELYSERDGYSIRGEIKGYSVRCSRAGLSLSGSLSQHYYPSNLYTMTREDTRLAVDKLCDTLHLDIHGAKVRRLDLAATIQTHRPPSSYFEYLGGKPMFTKLLVAPTTLEYRTGQRELCLYDKWVQAKARGVEIPPKLQCYPNLLRYELRYLNRIRQQLKAPEVTAATLYAPNFYYPLIQRWKAEFDSIQKIRRTIPMQDNIITPKDAEKALLARLIMQNGGATYIDDFLAYLKARNTFALPKYYSQFKRKLQGLLAMPEGGSVEVIRELENEISNTARYAQ